MRDGSERRVGQAASPRSWWRIIWACSALNGGNRSAVVFAACRIASRSVSLRASSSIASRGSVVVVGVLVWGVGMLFIPDRCVHTPAHRKKQPLHLAIQGKASYYMCMFSAVVPVKAPGSGPGTGVPIRHPRSSNPSGLPVVKILHHRQHPIRQGSTVVANCHHRHPRDRPGSTVPARCRHRRLTVDLHGGAILAPPSGGGDGGENFAPPWPGGTVLQILRDRGGRATVPEIFRPRWPVVADGTVVPIRHHRARPHRSPRDCPPGVVNGVRNFPAPCHQVFCPRVPVAEVVDGSAHFADPFP